MARGLAGPVEEVFARFAALNAALMTRTAPIIALAESAAAIDPELAEHRDRAHAASRADLHALAAELKREARSPPASANKTPPTPCTRSPPTPASTSASPRMRLDTKPATPTSSPAPSQQLWLRHERLTEMASDVVPSPAAVAPAAPSPAQTACRRQRTADMPTADMPTADMRTADLPTADMRTADMRTADMRTADMRTADMRTADMRTADMRTADMRTADMRTADNANRSHAVGAVVLVGGRASAIGKKC